MFENHEFEIFLHASSLRKSQKAFSETATPGALIRAWLDCDQRSKLKSVERRTPQVLINSNKLYQLFTFSKWIFQIKCCF